MSTQELLESILNTTFPDSTIKVEDVSGGCGAKFDVIIGSDKFEGITLLERHRMVNESISSLMEKIHAINLKTWTKKQYAEKMKA